MHFLRSTYVTSTLPVPLLKTSQILFCFSRPQCRVEESDKTIPMVFLTPTASAIRIAPLPSGGGKIHHASEQSSEGLQ